MTEPAAQPAVPLDDTNLRGAGSGSGLFWGGVAALVALTFLAYLPAIRGTFIWDDDYYVQNDMALRTFGGIQDIWAGIVRPHEYIVRVTPQYYPMTVTSFWLEYRLWGLNTIGYHVVNILLHACSAWLLWIILRKLRVPGAWVIAAIWALHPVQVESVAWITERKNVLSGAFFFASLLVYLRFCGLDPAAPAARPVREEHAGDDEATGEADEENPEDQLTFGLPEESWKLYLLALVLFIAAVLSKSVTGTLPAVVLLLLWWKRGRVAPKRDLLPLLPFFVIAIAMGTFTAWMERNVVGARGPEWQHTAAEHVLLAGRAVWFYVLKLFVPLGLSFNYPRWDLRASSPVQWIYPVAALLVIAALWARRRQIGRGPLVAVLYFVGSLVPAMGFTSVFPMRYSYVADHFQYLACVGIIALVVAAIDSRVRDKSALAPIAVIVLAVLFMLTLKQAAVYRSPETLWTDTIHKNPRSWMARANLASYYVEQSPPRFADAEKEARASLEINPDNPEAIVTLGAIAEAQGHLNDAIALFQQAVRMHILRYRQTGVQGAPFAVAWRSLGHAFAAKGDLNKAVEAYQNAIKINPDYQRALNDLGGFYNMQRRYDEAVKVLEKAVELNPQDYRAHNNLGTALLGQGKLEEAAGEWYQVFQLDPGNYVAITSIGTALAQMGRYDEAIAMFQKALSLKPDYAPAMKNLEVAKRLQAQAATRPTSRPASHPSSLPSRPAR